MNHAFIINVHKDIDQGRLLCDILKRYYPRSDRIFYCDGPETDRMYGWPAQVILNTYEPDKVTGLMTALNILVKRASDWLIQYASFLHADMVPTDAAQFHRFLDRFAASGKALTYNTVWPAKPYLDFCNLHFDVKQCADMGLFPVETKRYSNDPSWHNEAQLTMSWDNSCPTWRERTYQPWTIVLPYTNMPGTVMDKHGHLPGGWFVFHNYTPETSVIHTNDPWFWANYDTIARDG